MNITSNNQCISWFKLSEFIERKEKEKALILYKLLANSLNNSGFNNYLFAEIHNYFEEFDIIKTNLIEAINYYQNKNIEISISIREEIIKSNPNILNTEYFNQVQALANDYTKYYNKNTKLIKKRLDFLQKKINYKDKKNIINILAAETSINEDKI